MSISLSAIRKSVATVTIASMVALSVPAGFAFAARAINSATVDGQSVTVETGGDPISVSVNVTTTGSGSADNWSSTGWRISTNPTSGGTSGCDNGANENTAGNHTDSFDVNVPGTDGTYNLYLIAYEDNSCSTGGSTTFTLANSVIVQNSDRITSSATLDGGPTTTVYPGDTITAVVTGSITGGTGGDWEGTGYLVSTTAPGSMSCSNTSDESDPGVYTRSISITAPSTPGIYNAYFRISGEDGCGSSNGTLLTMTDAITVLEPRTTDSATLNGGSSVTVAPGETITAEVTGTIAGGSYDWDATEWLIDTSAPGSTTCANTSDTSTAGTHDRTFSITAPLTPGTYNAYFLINGNSACSPSQAGTLLTMIDAVTVQQTDINTLVATGINKLYDGNNTATVILSSPDILGGDDVEFSYTATFDDETLGTGKPVTVTGVSISGGADAAKYNLVDTDADTTADIVENAVIVALDPLGQDLFPYYDGAPKPLTFSSTPTSTTILVTYDGDTNPPTNAGDYDVLATVTDYGYAGSAMETLTIQKAVTDISITNAASLLATDSVVGEPVQIDWSVLVGPGAGTPDGTVMVSDGANDCSAPVGDGQCSITFDAPGTYDLVATYSGSSNFEADSSVIAPHTVIAADTTTTITNALDLTSGPSEATGSYEVKWSVSVVAPGSGPLTGTVTVDGTSGASCSADVAVGKCDMNSPVGIETLTATYSGDSNFNSSISTPVDHELIDSTSGSSGSGGGGGNGPILSGAGAVLGASIGPSGANAPQGQVLGEATTTVATTTPATTDEPTSCSALITKVPMSQGRATNDPEEVKKLQNFLNGELGTTLEVSGTFDAATTLAVNAFQLKYTTDILTPWGLTQPTGIVGILSQWKINMLHCPSLNLTKPSVN